MVKRLKCDLGDDRLSKRGNEAFQAYLDKSMIAYAVFFSRIKQGSGIGASGI